MPSVMVAGGRSGILPALTAALRASVQSWGTEVGVVPVAGYLACHSAKREDHTGQEGNGEMVKTE